jgi:hypothetical protein
VRSNTTIAKSRGIVVTTTDELDEQMRLTFAAKSNESNCLACTIMPGA